jgi:CheY-like chemotaxis protein
VRVAPVLILSADPDTQDLYVAALRSRRRPVYGVCNAQEAVALAGVRPGAIVVDVRSEPEWEQIDQLRESGPMRRVPIVVVTGFVLHDGRFRRRAASSGCAAFLAKPSLPDVVEHTIDRVMRGEHGIELITMDGADAANRAR